MAADLLRYALGARPLRRASSRAGAGRAARVGRARRAGRRPAAGADAARAAPHPAREPAEEGRRAPQRAQAPPPAPPLRKAARSRERRERERQASRLAGARPPRLLEALPLAASALVAVVLAALPLAAVLAQQPGEGGWFSEEIEFQPPPPLPGRRLFVEELTVSGERAKVVLRGRRRRGPAGPRLRRCLGARVPLLTRSPRSMRASAPSYDLPLDGPAPSLVFSWEDELGQAGRSASRASNCRIRSPQRRASCAACGSPRWAGSRTPSRGPSPRRARARSRSPWSSASPPGTTPRR